MYKGKKVSVAMPAFNEAGAIESVVRDYLANPFVDEVIVGDNNSTDGTGSLAAAAGARVIQVPQQGYGYACKAALDACTGDLLVLTESDGSLMAENVESLLVLSHHFDCVKGARSNLFLVQPGADWDFLLMFSNWMMAKFIQVLYLGHKTIEDVSMREAGGTQRVMRRESYEVIRPYIREGASAFLPETVTLMLRHNMKILEVPIVYRPRIGESKITGNRLRAAALAFRMVGVISRNRFRKLDKPT
jgi:glycosyltransferase involved in cell wall biosynthesis